MGSNRKQPFGYRMEQGQIVIHPEEATAVRYPFREYDQGKSFLDLTNAMKEWGIPYDGDKLWNKNMIARILADGRYRGLPPYPLLIPLALFQSVTEKRNKRSAPIQQTQAQKLLRQKCNGKVSPEIESEVLALHRPAETSPAVAALEATVDDLLRQLPVDEEQAEKAIFDLAVARYEAIGSEEYETQRLQKVFQEQGSMAELDAELIRKTIRTVIVDGNGTVTIKLKNEQVIGRESTP